MIAIEPTIGIEIETAPACQEVLGTVAVVAGTGFAVADSARSDSAYLGVQPVRQSSLVAAVEPVAQVALAGQAALALLHSALVVFRQSSLSFLKSSVIGKSRSTFAGTGLILSPWCPTRENRAARRLSASLLFTGKVLGFSPPGWPT